MIWYNLSVERIPHLHRAFKAPADAFNKKGSSYGNMEKVVYLDNAATTPCAPEALEMMVKALSGACGNPSSHYSVGYEAKEFVDTGRAQVAKAINASPAELFFTSCGSELTTGP